MIMPASETFDVAIIGAGVFGAWTAYELQRAGLRVVILDAYGPANSRASSGGESRIIRMGYGADEIYTRMAMRSLPRWLDFFEEANADLFVPTGFLWLTRDDDPYSIATRSTLNRCGVETESLTSDDLRYRWPQIRFDEDSSGLFEPKSGALMSKRAVAAVLNEAVKRGARYLQEKACPPESNTKVLSIKTESGRSISAQSFVYACGPWLPKVFPNLLKELISPSRQEVFFFGVEAGDTRFSPPAMPIFIDFLNESYAIPVLENRGFKVAIDRRGLPIDPDTAERIVTPEALAAVRAYLARRVPDLANAPVVESRVCQYENTANGDFLIDRHPDFDNVWIVGGGSGHGFKHGPAVGEYVAALVTGAPVEIEPRFTFAAKNGSGTREVY